MSLTLPQMVKVRQQFHPLSVGDVGTAIREQFQRNRPQDVIRAGETVAITAGSRGIHRIDIILRHLIIELKKIGAEPFIVPAMGSHGGATAAGQAMLLSHFGITEEAMQAPVRSSMAVVEVGCTSDNLPVVIDAYAAEADHILVVNRIKPHTDFEAEIESGLMKMLAIGLGKQQGADAYHTQFMLRGHCRVLTDAARVLLEKCPVAYGIGIVENEIDTTAIIEMMPATAIEEEEKRLLQQAKKFMPRLPFDRIDLLIVDEIGKRFSGTGMDQNIIARSVVPYHVVPATPRITRIFVRDLAKDSGGNGLGIGNADFITNRLVDKIDWPVSSMNSITAACPEMIRIPPAFTWDLEALEIAYKTLPISDSANSRVVHIKNTLHLEEFYISEAMIADVDQLYNVEILGPSGPMRMDADGNLQSC